MLNVLFFRNCLVVSKRFNTFATSKDYFDYPGKFPERARLYRHYPIHKELRLQLFFVFLQINTYLYLVRSPEMCTFAAFKTICCLLMP